jgi:hypothetical protein
LIAKVSLAEYPASLFVGPAKGTKQMKTIWKVISGTAIAAVLMIPVARDAQAGGAYSFGFSYHGGSRHHWGGSYAYGYYPPRVYYVPRTVYYYSPPPPVVYTQPVPAAVPSQPVVQPQRFGVADVKALVQAGVSDEVIMSQIKNARVVYRLTTAEIIDLKESGVSERLIDFMINTPDL